MKMPKAPELWPGRGGPGCDYISAPPGPAFIEACPRKTVVLGSTGSIGRNAIAILDNMRSLFQVAGLACGKNARLLASQALRFKPPFLAVQDEDSRNELKNLLPPDYRPEILTGPEGYATLAAMKDTDLVVSAQSGAAGLAGTLAAALAGHAVALANKESLVLAGGLVRRICKKTGASILPVDSEHFALFQCLAGREQNAESLVLTASGGPFRGWSREKIQAVTPELALAHPSWNMGAKITIDSATLMNKGLEVIEAMHLFGVEVSHIQVLVHPQSIVHSLVRFKDNGMLAQLAVPDMKLPISACLCWPQMPVAPVNELNLAQIGALSFYEPDYDLFPCLSLALRAAKTVGKGTCFNKTCIVLNAANEAAVRLFCDGRIGFCEIARLVEYALDKLAPVPECLEVMPDYDNPAREALDLWAKIAALDSHTREFVIENSGEKI